MLKRMTEGGTYTLVNGRTVLTSVSAPGWSATLCGMGVESTGIVGNSWRPTWQGSSEAITPVTGTCYYNNNIFIHTF